MGEIEIELINESKEQELILEKEASASQKIVLQEKNVTPKTTTQTIEPDEEYNGLSRVNIEAVTSSIDSNIISSNIKSDVSILGVVGTLKEGITPTGTIEINENGDYDVTEFSEAKVNIQSGGSTDNKLKELLEGTIVELTDYEITAVRKYGFAYCEDLIKVDLPNVATIGENAFARSENLIEVNLPNCETATDYSFNYCYSLKNVNMPKLQTVPSYMFQRCEAIQEIDLPSITRIFASAFYYCKSLEKLILRSETMVTLANKSAFLNTKINSGTGYIYVPDNLIEEYKVATNWTNFADQFKGLSELEG